VTDLRLVEAPPLPNPPVLHAVDIERFVLDASGVHKIAQGIANTNFVPTAMQGRPDEITAAILFGRELGLDPMTSLQTIHVIERRPTLSANAMRGLAQAAGVKFRLDEANDTRVVMSAMAPGDPGWTTVTWTMDRAKKMNLATKTNWQKMPQAMLLARATSELCRLVAANVLIGLPYSAEELADGLESTAVNVAPPVKEAATRPVKRAPVRDMSPPETVRTVLDDLPENSTDEIGYDKADVPQRPVGEVVVRENGITLRTRTALMATFNDANIRSRNDRLAKVTEIVGRDIYSVNMLTEDEGRKVLTVMQAGASWTDGDPA